MKFRGISAVLVAALVAFAATTANAAKVGFIAAQSSNGVAGTTANAGVPAGFVLYTVALKTDASDGTGSFGISLTFNGIAGTSPVQATAGTGGVNTIEGLQAAIDNGASASKLNVGTNADTWLYTSPNNPGQLLDIDGNPATGNPGFNIPGLTPNPLALTWQTLATPNGITGTTGNAFSITGPWGNPFAPAGDPILAASQLGPGVYPIAQVLVPVGSSVPVASGPSLGISAPNGVFYNVLGGVGGDGGAGAFLSGNPLTYLSNPLALPNLSAVPEPSTIILAGLGIAGVLFARRRRS